jgi:hypothetical protein
MKVMMIAIALALPTVAAPAQAQGIDAYECDHTVVGAKSKGWGFGNCLPPNGAPWTGPIHGTFAISSRQGDAEPYFVCKDPGPVNFPSGQAEGARRVSGFSCTTEGNQG